MKSLLERFEAKVDRTAADECWNWLGHITPGGYGYIRTNGAKEHAKPVHRVAYELFVGPIPDGLEIDHLCFNRKCVNPAHLEPVTKQENHRRRRGRPRHHPLGAHCRNGHPRAGNTKVNSHGARYCVLCARDATRRYRTSRNP